MEHAPDYNPTEKATELMVTAPRGSHPLYDVFSSAWRTVCSKYMGAWDHKPLEKPLSFREFIDHAWLWATSGSSTYGHIFDSMGNKQTHLLFVIIDSAPHNKNVLHAIEGKLSSNFLEGISPPVGENTFFCLF
jgi:hypothetical protein